MNWIKNCLKFKKSKEQERIDYIIELIKSRCNEVDYRVMRLEELDIISSSKEITDEVLRVLSSHGVGFIVTKSGNLIIANIMEE